MVISQHNSFDIISNMDSNHRLCIISLLLFPYSCYDFRNMIDAKATDERLIKPFHIILFFVDIEVGNYEI